MWPFTRSRESLEEELFEKETRLTNMKVYKSGFTSDYVVLEVEIAVLKRKLSKLKS